MPRRNPARQELDHRALLPSWETFLRTDGLQPNSIDRYRSRVLLYLDWAERRGHRPAIITRELVRDWMAEQLDRYATETVISRVNALRRYTRWLADELGVLDADPLHGLRAPRPPELLTPPLTAAELKALLDACRGPGRTLRQRPFQYVRDEFIVRLMAQTGMRAGEVVALTVDDVDLREGLVVVRRGKGGKGRQCAIGPKTCLAGDRYMMKRKDHRLAKDPKLLLGAGGKGFGYDALRRSLEARAAEAGITAFHPHRLRHTQADRWLAAGGSLPGLMANNGWSRYESVQRYTKYRNLQRAMEEARTLDLGDV